MSKFNVGEMVAYKPESTHSRHAVPGPYEVIAVMPSERGPGASYRIKSMSEDHQPAADEAELRKV
jgi:hypothetical protein